MRKVTTTKKINGALTNNLVKAEKVEVYYKTSGKTEIMDTNKFTENLSFLCESGIFSDAIGWHFERDYRTGIYEIECSRMDGSVDVIITAYFRKSDDVNEEDIDEMLLKIEDEE